ncbi:MAG TPA: GNAT family N-acetyltransferase [Roseimicrobium sp.]|nr:GNAT family N-acetyltransferase [Roseimicrobium sp.]
MSLKESLHVKRLEDDNDRQSAMRVLKATYREEKNWVADEQKMFSSADLQDPGVSWFVVFSDDQPIGVLRVLYNPPLGLYKEYGFKMIGGGIDVEKFIRNNRIAEIGRFAVLPEYRRYTGVVLALMRAASRETVERGFTHYITDIFEGEKHSPYLFHTRVMGFQPVATHDVGELNCPNRRITMVLDIKTAYNRLRKTQRKVFVGLTGDWPDDLHAQLHDGTEQNGFAEALNTLKRAVSM